MGNKCLRSRLPFKAVFLFVERTLKLRRSFLLKSHKLSLQHHFLEANINCLEFFISLVCRVVRLTKILVAPCNISGWTYTKTSLFNTDTETLLLIRNSNLTGCLEFYLTTLLVCADSVKCDFPDWRMRQEFCGCVEGNPVENVTIPLPRLLYVPGKNKCWRWEFRMG